MTFQPDYVAQLEALPPKRRRAWLDGDWDVYEGQFFDDFVNDPDHYGDGLYTHVIEPFAPPKRWQIYRSYDFGYGKPFSCGWWAVDEEGVMEIRCQKDQKKVLKIHIPAWGQKDFNVSVNGKVLANTALHDGYLVIDADPKAGWTQA